MALAPRQPNRETSTIWKGLLCGNCAGRGVRKDAGRTSSETGVEQFSQFKPIALLSSLQISTARQRVIESRGGVRATATYERMSVTEYWTWIRMMRNSPNQTPVSSSLGLKNPILDASFKINIYRREGTRRYRCLDIVDWETLRNPGFDINFFRD
jgi:hypothetical protein